MLAITPIGTPSTRFSKMVSKATPESAPETVWTSTRSRVHSPMTSSSKLVEAKSSKKTWSRCGRPARESNCPPPGSVSYHSTRRIGRSSSSNVQRPSASVPAFSFHEAMNHTGDWRASYMSSRVGNSLRVLSPGGERMIQVARETARETLAKTDVTYPACSATVASCGAGVSTQSMRNSEATVCTPAMWKSGTCRESPYVSPSRFVCSASMCEIIWLDVSKQPHRADQSTFKRSLSLQKCRI